MIETGRGLRIRLLAHALEVSIATVLRRCDIGFQTRNLGVCRIDGLTTGNEFSKQTTALGNQLFHTSRFGWIARTVLGGRSTAIDLSEFEQCVLIWFRSVHTSNLPAKPPSCGSVTTISWG